MASCLEMRQSAAGSNIDKDARSHLAPASFDLTNFSRSGRAAKTPASRQALWGLGVGDRHIQKVWLTLSTRVSCRRLRLTVEPQRFSG